MREALNLHTLRSLNHRYRVFRLVPPTPEADAGSSCSEVAEEAGGGVCGPPENKLQHEERTNAAATAAERAGECAGELAPRTGFSAADCSKAARKAIFDALGSK